MLVESRLQEEGKEIMKAENPPLEKELIVICYPKVTDCGKKEKELLN